MNKPRNNPKDLEERAKEAAGNWKQFESFGWHDRPEDEDNWYIFYTHNRDSTLVDLSNAKTIEKELAEFPEEDCRGESHGHWACGWIDGYAIRVYDDRGNITPAFVRVCEIQDALADYPLLDEEDHSRREYEATLESIENEGRRLVNGDTPNDWASQVFGWLWDNNQRAVESRDDQGGCPDEEDIAAALEGLGLPFAKDEEEVGT